MTRLLKKPLLLLLAAKIGGALLSSSAAHAELPLCGSRIDMIAKLREYFSEVPTAVGVVDETAVIEVFVAHTGTWTILATGTDGHSCVLSSGEGWDSRAAVAGHDA